MDAQITNKKNRSILIFSGIVIVILLITVIFQYRYITVLKEKLNKITLSGRNQSGLNARATDVEQHSEMTGSSDSNSDKEKIKTLKSQIADMQEWQDYLEEKLAKYEMTSEEKFYNSIYSASKSKNSSRFEPFFEENNISPAKKTDFIELLAQSRLELVDLDKNSMNTEDYQKEEEKIKSKYDDLISNLLSEENYIAYQDFLKSEEDRPLIRGFKEVVFTGDNQLNKQQEKDLLSAISSNRLAIEDTEGISIYDSGNELSLEDIKKSMNAHKKILNGYLDVSKDILTDSQFTNFNKFIKLQISSIETREKQLPQILEIMNSDTEKAEN